MSLPPDCPRQHASHRMPGEPALVAVSGDTAATNAEKPVKQHATRQQMTGNCPELAAIHYVIVFNVDSSDCTNHAGNWLCLKKPDHWKNVPWIAHDKEMTLDNRNTVMEMKSPSMDDVFGRTRVKVFARVEFGKLALPS